MHAQPNRMHERRPSFVSATKSMAVLSNPMFCGDSGKRMIFAIHLTQGQAREITRYSLVAGEDEVLLPPGCRFRVESVLRQGDLSIIQLKELPSDEWIVDISPAAKAAQVGDGEPAVPPPAVPPPPQQQQLFRVILDHKDGLKVRSGIELKSESVGHLPRGTVFETVAVGNSSDGTRRVQLIEPISGWVSWKSDLIVEAAN